MEGGGGGGGRRRGRSRQEEEEEGLPGLTGCQGQDRRLRRSPHSTVPHYTVPHYTVPRYTVLHYPALHRPTPPYTTLHHTTPHYTLLQSSPGRYYTAVRSSPGGAVSSGSLEQQRSGARRALRAPRGLEGGLAFPTRVAFWREVQLKPHSLNYSSPCSPITGILQYSPHYLLVFLSFSGHTPRGTLGMPL